MTTTDPNTSNTAVSELLSPRWRAMIYVAAGMLASSWFVIEEKANLHWGFHAAYAAWGTGVSLLAASNTAKST